MGFTVSAYLFFTTIAGMISTAALDWLQNYLGAPDNIPLYGQTLCAFIMFSYVGSIPFFWLAGRSYEKQMK